jgi:hypothetical protein
LIWLGTLSHELLESGEFERLVREYAVTGATSNPTIFANDHQVGPLRRALRSLATAGIEEPEELFFALPSTTPPAQPTCFGPYTTRAVAETASSPSNARPTWPTTAKRRSSRRSSCRSGSPSRT